MTQAPDSRDNYCYRHPNRQSFVLCQRCGRTICPECQTQAPVGVICPECMRESRQSAPRTRPRVVTAVRSSVRSGTPVVTIGLMAVAALVFIAELVTGGFNGLTGNVVTQQLDYAPLRLDTSEAPWRMVTSIFVHLSILHIVFNLYSLYIFGSMLERMLGRVRFLVLFLLAGVGGSVGVLLIDPAASVAGASGAIFGMLGAYFVIVRRLGGNTVQLLVVIAVNLVIGFLVPGIAWQAHVGGLVVGAAIGLIYLETRDRRRRPVQIVALAGVFVLLIVLAVVGSGLLPFRLGF